MEYFGVIYKGINTVNGMMYIGHSTNYKNRINSHRNSSVNPNMPSYNYPIYVAIREFGWDSFKWSVICDVSAHTKKSLKLGLSWLEAYYIQEYDSQNNGYNVSGGVGLLGLKQSDDHINKRKMVGEKNGMYGKKHSKESLRLMSERHSGENNAFYGKRHTEETKRQLSESKKGRRPTEESIKRMIASRIGKYAGKDHARSKAVYQYSVNGEMLCCFDNARHAQREIGVSSEGIGKCCRGDAVLAGGFVWRYEGDGFDKYRTEHKPHFSRPVSQFTKNGIFVRHWDSITEATKSTGIDGGDIGKCCKGKNHTAGGYIWKDKIKNND